METGSQLLAGMREPGIHTRFRTIPFTINNDGNLSISAAEVFFQSLVAADRAGSLEPDIFVAELGIGVGLFARFFLDSFRRLCERHDKDYYDRVCYVAGDYSEKMLLDASRHGVFANHAGRYVLRVVDALCPEKSLSADSIFGESEERRFRGIILNYLLDCLPAAVLKIEDGQLRQLHVRTCLARGADLSDYGDLTVEELVRLTGSRDAENSNELRGIYGLFASEYDYRSVSPADVPNGDFAIRFARSVNQPVVVHNYGAIQALESLLGLLSDSGVILINDYGHAQPEAVEAFEHQRYSQSTFIGVNFPLLKSHFSDRGATQWVEPAEGDNPRIHARMLGRQLASETIHSFQERFCETTQGWLDEPAGQARNLANAGRFEAALLAYQEALERQPFNWALMNEVAHFLTFSLHDPRAGREMARTALAFNPACSADLWNTLGDSLFELGQVEESRQAYLRALDVNPEDARAHFNLTLVHTRAKEYAEALHRIARALTLDKPGAYRERLLHTQSEVLAQLAQRHREECLRMVNRVSTRQDFPKPQGPRPEGTPKDAPDPSQGGKAQRMSSHSGFDGTGQQAQKSE